MMKNKANQFTKSIRYTAFLTVTLITSNAWPGAPAVCPDKSAGDHPFDMHNISECVWVNNDYNKLPVRHATIDYNIYCPGRMTQKQSIIAGRMMVAGKSIKEGYSAVKYPNIIIRQHKERYLVPVYVSTPHRFHYGCVIGGRNGVATHIKVRVKAVAMPYDRWAEKRMRQKAKSKRLKDVAASCHFHGNQNGGIAIGARMDREYKCTNMIRSSERNIAEYVAYILITRDLIGDIRSSGGKICILQSTDIQCAPCSKSDKLIVRILTISQAQHCPAGQTWGHSIK